MSAWLSTDAIENECIKRYIDERNWHHDDVQVYRYSHYDRDVYWTFYESSERLKDKEQMYAMARMNGWPFIAHIRYGGDFQGYIGVVVTFFGLHWTMLETTEWIS